MPLPDPNRSDDAPQRPPERDERPLAEDPTITDTIETATLSEQLGRLGVRPDDLVMVHASLRAIGPVEGGATGVLEATRRAIGPNGTILMTIGAHDPMAWVNARPEAERATLLAGSEPFDALTTPADPENGVLAEVFRAAPGTRVSDHPEGRFAAAGPLAATIVEDQPWDDYYGPGSPLATFVAHHGRVLRLGADPDTVTVLHWAEWLVDLPVKRRVRRHRLVKGPNGPEVRCIETLDDSNGIVDRPGEDYFATILRAYLGLGRAARGPVGGAPSELLDAGDLVAFAVAWMGRHLR